jgi:hypothetical protein
MGIREVGGVNGELVLREDMANRKKEYFILEPKK